MRRKSKKLMLCRDTLSNLNPAEMGQAAGGVTFGPRCPSFTCDPCDYTGRDTCFTCVQTC